MQEFHRSPCSMFYSDSERVRSRSILTQQKHMFHSTLGLIDRRHNKTSKRTFHHNELIIHLRLPINATKTESCLIATQLIYINIIMDLSGALALAITHSAIDIAHEHFSSQAKIMTPQMYRQILLTFLYMAGIMTVVILAGKAILIGI